MADNDPETDSEKAIEDAFVLVVRSKTELPFTAERFLTICRSCPAYTATMVDRYRLHLISHVGPHREAIHELLRTVKWEFCGSQSIIRQVAPTPADDLFLWRQLQDTPEAFSRDDLRYLLTKYEHSHGHVVGKAARDLLTQRVSTFADRLAAEPPGMSEDLTSLKKSIRDYRFTPELNQILEKIDTAIEEQSDEFDQASTMRHIRSFFEELHECIGKKLQEKRPNVGNGSNLSQCGTAIDYLERKGVTTDKIKNLGRCLYSILSDDDYGVHSLKAMRDYTRLCRNMVVEYAVTLFFELDRRLSMPGDA